MEPKKRQFLPLRTRRMALVLLAVAAPMLLAWVGPAQAKRIVGTKGPDKLVGSAKADVIKSRGGNDRLNGRGGGDRRSGGPGADRLNAVDGRRDRLVRGGPGKDVCRIDAADRPNVKSCETVKIAKGRGPGGGPGGELTCATPPEGARVAPGGLSRAAQEDAPPTFSDPFYSIAITINASVDGRNGDELPISIEEVCTSALGWRARPLSSSAAKVALISSATKVFDAAGQALTGEAAATALAGADSVSLEAQLMRPARWRRDEDGQPVPSFETSRIEITD